jgi:hypothetical protein
MCGGHTGLTAGILVLIAIESKSDQIRHDMLKLRCVVKMKISYSLLKVNGGEVQMASKASAAREKGCGKIP